MKTTKCEILWSPLCGPNDPPYFMALTSTELTMYKCSTTPDANNTGIKLSDNLYAVATHISREFNCNNVSCMGWCPSPETTGLLAIGKVESLKLINFDKDRPYELHGTVNLTTVLHMQNKDLQSCVALDWNSLADPLGVYMLATAFLRGKTYIWQINCQKITSDSPHWELLLDNGEFVQSLAWRSQQSSNLIVGTTKDRLKVILIKGVREQQLVASVWTKAIYNVTPHHHNKDLVLTSTQDGSIHLWDIRNFSYCFAVLNSDQRQICKLAWSPVHWGNGLIAAALYRDSAHVRLFTVFHLYGQEAGGSGSAGDLEPFVADRAIELGRDSLQNQEAISAFAWHGSAKNVLLAMISRNKLVASAFTDPTTLHILPDNSVLFCANRKIHTLQMVPEADELDVFPSLDLSDLFKYRMEYKFGLDVRTPWGEMAPEVISHPLNQLAKPFWNWLAQRQKNGIIDSKTADLRGVSSLLAASARSSGTSVNSTPSFPGLRMRTSSAQLGRDEVLVKLDTHEFTTKMYISPDRQEIVRLCGWPVITSSPPTNESSSAILSFVNEISKVNGQTARAAACALYLLKMETALNVLSRTSSEQGSSGSDDMLPIVALALPGVLSVESNLPKMYENNLNKVTEPYLKLLLTYGHFLSSAESLLQDDALVLEDRVAIAAMYLPDDKFHKLISAIGTQHVNAGRLTGLLFTGLESPDFVRLLQNYINVTGDIQTVAFACAHAFSQCRRPPPEVDAWTEAYRQLLNRFRMFRQRAAFDDFRRSLSGIPGKPRPTVSLGCSYCEKAVVQSVPLAGMQRVLPIYCQSCKRPLPRCAVCLARVGDDGWITWCQTCRHGGHAHHLLQWFSQYVYCPVVGCHCTCMQLDAPF